MKKRKAIILATCILSILVGCLSMYYPNTKEIAKNYSYERVKEDLKVISKEPHSTLYHQEALEDVRKYIVNELETLNMNPEIFNYKSVENDKGDIADIHNIYAKMDGKNGEDGSYILLVAHYDSAGTNPQNDKGYSYGAADDGYGVSTILEVLRNIKGNEKLVQNGIKVLITDGEEMHLVGSREEFTNHSSLYENVSFVINLEARGNSGPVIMFQINEKNDRVLKLYKNANYPMTSSLITDLFMESGRSDFLNMKKNGLVGINLTTLDKVEYYHTPEDSYENINKKSLLHYGDQVLPIVKEFIYSDKYNDVNYLKQGKKSIFFTLLPNVILDYSLSLGRILSIIIFLIVIVSLIQNRDKMKGIFKSTGRNLFHIIGLSVLGFFISLSLATVSGVNFSLNHMGKIPKDDITVIALPILIFILSCKYDLKKKDKIYENFLAGVLIQTILLCISMILLPGASYLTMIPLMFILISFVIKRVTNIDILKYTFLLTIVAMILLYLPLIFILHMAFSIGALPFIIAILMIMKSLIVPWIQRMLVD